MSAEKSFLSPRPALLNSPPPHNDRQPARLGPGRSPTGMIAGTEIVLKSLCKP